MKASDTLFLIGIVLAIAGAGSGALALLGVGGVIFVVGIVVRALTRGEPPDDGDPDDSDAAR